MLPRKGLWSLVSSRYARAVLACMLCEVVDVGKLGVADRDGTEGGGADL